MSEDFYTGFELARGPRHKLRVSHVRIPTLMLNGRYDDRCSISLETDVMVLYDAPWERRNR